MIVQVNEKETIYKIIINRRTNRLSGYSAYTRSCKIAILDISYIK